MRGRKLRWYRGPAGANRRLWLASAQRPIRSLEWSTAATPGSSMPDQHHPTVGIRMASQPRTDIQKGHRSTLGADGSRTPRPWQIGQFGLIIIYRRAVFLAFFFAAFFSMCTPLNFLAACLALRGRFSAMNSPDDLLRLVQADAPPSFVFFVIAFHCAFSRIIAYRLIDRHPCSPILRRLRRLRCPGSAP